MTPQEFIAKRNVILTKTLPNCLIIPHVDDLIKKLSNMGLKLAVATSCVRHFHELKTSNHKELFSLFDCDICGDEVSQAKPVVVYHISMIILNISLHIKIGNINV